MKDIHWLDYLGFDDFRDYFSSNYKKIKNKKKKFVVFSMK